MNKFRKIILILLGVIFIMILVYLTSSFNTEKKEDKDMNKFPYEEGVFPSKEEREMANKGIVYLKNIKEISEVWITNKPITKVVVNIEYIINNIFNPAINSINDLEDFFQENKEEISKRLYINNYIDFQKIIIKITEGKRVEIIESKILENVTKNKDGKIYSKIELKLKNNKKSVLNLKIDESTFQVYITE